MKLHTILLLFIAFLAAGLPAAVANTTTSQRVSAKLELTDQQLASLKQVGYLKLPIPYQFRNRINSLILKRPNRFKNKAGIQFNDVDKRAGLVAVDVDDATLERLDYQPVELKIYESGYTTIVVRYQPGNSIFLNRSYDVVRIDLRDGRFLVGRIADRQVVAINTHGNLQRLNLKEIAQMSFVGGDMLTAITNDGRRVTGKIDFRRLQIFNRWALETLNVNEIASVTSLPSQFDAFNQWAHEAYGTQSPRTRFPQHNPNIHQPRRTPPVVSDRLNRSNRPARPNRPARSIRPNRKSLPSAGKKRPADKKDPAMKEKPTLKPRGSVTQPETKAQPTKPKAAKPEVTKPKAAKPRQPKTESKPKRFKPKKAPLPVEPDSKPAPPDEVYPNGLRSPSKLPPTGIKRKQPIGKFFSQSPPPQPTYRNWFGQ